METSDGTVFLSDACFFPVLSVYRWFFLRLEADSEYKVEIATGGLVVTGVEGAASDRRRYVPWQMWEIDFTSSGLFLKTSDICRSEKMVSETIS